MHMALRFHRVIAWSRIEPVRDISGKSMKLFQITACDRNCMSILNFYDKKRITITNSKTFFKNVLKNDISRCAKKAQKSF